MPAPAIRGGKVGSPHALVPSPTSAKSPHTQGISPTAASATHSRSNSLLTIRPTAGQSTRPHSRPQPTGIPMASILSPAPAPAAAKPPGSVTSKEWVIPPRPKPGRKPATDTPPTKRKAQNRAAQRAFRERRAARVGELEEQLEEQAEEHQREQKKLHDRIHELEVEAQTLMTRCQVLENMLERERLERRRWSEDAAPLPSMAPSRNGGITLLSPRNGQPGETFAAGPSVYNNHIQSASSNQPTFGVRQSTASTTPAPAPRHPVHSFSISQIISPPEDAEIGEQSSLSCGSCAPGGPCACAEEALANAMVGCGKCSLGTKCECLEATLNATMGSSDLKRPLRSTSPSTAPGEKRARSDAAMETDFTAFFSSSKPNPPAPAASRTHMPVPAQQPIPPRDSCGFCTEGTYCVCADAMAPVLPAAPIPPAPNPVANAARQVQTPPPSETDVVPPPLEVTATGAIKLPGVQSIKYGTRPAVERANKPKSTCGPGGPGTCAQCLADPMSGLFCRSLAATMEKNGQDRKGRGGCCGGGGAGGCCKTQPAKTAAKPQTNNFGLSLSCADTYKTLSSHRHFNQATDEIANWLPLLRAAPRPEAEQSATGTAPRPPIEVEAASIMSVLKGFDVRFASNA
ncbi:bZIP transcription factor HapX [Magnaporthiopsis poae ATCC 64411]|uniref:BZIP transcription factor HapX n=1 Tax=Magnaporthiopsis poae (strain ATCC 64411 / 73-15) TaxID=644358 RepID=A0A0C4DSP5_MAGP6|nr:bZIP transcription factor HapX [Magnaporthiopsis poae ATCC 64411]